MFYILLDQDDYYQSRGGNDWGRAERERDATFFESKEEAETEIHAKQLASFGARTVEMAY